MFHENLKRCREAAGLTQDDMAHKLGMSLRTYQSWEQGHREPGLETVWSLAQSLGISTDQLLACQPMTKRKGNK